MNSTLINNWNSVVSPSDHIWHLGDVSFGTVEQTEQVLCQLNGIKHLITGNHDRKGRCQKLDWSKYFVDQHDYYRLKVSVTPDATYKAVLCHFPLASWERGYYNFHGHWHTLPKEPKGMWMRYDVGVDLNNYTPVLLQDAVRLAVEGKEKVALY
jgi:calcineurin-like phosphoesterase family protein